MVRIGRIQNASVLNSFSSEVCPSEEAIKGCLSRLNQARTDRKQILSIEYILSQYSLPITSISLTSLIFEYALQLKSQIGLPLLLLAGYFLPLFSFYYHSAVKTRNSAPWTSHPPSSSPTSPTTTNPKPSYPSLSLYLTPSPSKTTRPLPSTATASKASLPSSLPISGSRTPPPLHFTLQNARKPQAEALALHSRPPSAPRRPP